MLDVLTVQAIRNRVSVPEAVALACCVLVFESELQLDEGLGHLLASEQDLGFEWRWGLLEFAP
jgi:hypothetical protein